MLRRLEGEMQHMGSIPEIRLLAAAQITRQPKPPPYNIRTLIHAVMSINLFRNFKNPSIQISIIN